MRGRGLSERIGLCRVADDKRVDHGTGTVNAAPFGNRVGLPRKGLCRVPGNDRVGHREIGRVDAAAVGVGAVSRTGCVCRGQSGVIRNRRPRKNERAGRVNAAAVGHCVSGGKGGDRRPRAVVRDKAVGQRERKCGGINPPAARQNAAGSHGRGQAVLHGYVLKLDLGCPAAQRKDPDGAPAVDGKTALKAGSVDRDRFGDFERAERRGKYAGAPRQIGIESDSRRNLDTADRRTGVVERFAERNGAVRQVKLVVEGVHHRQAAPPGAHFRRAGLGIGIRAGADRFHGEIVLVIAVQVRKRVRSVGRLNVVLDRTLARPPGDLVRIGMFDGVP